MDIRDEHGNSVNIHFMEAEEQRLVNEYIEPDDSVLELGGRYGSVSCIINSKLKNKTKHFVVEPDNRVWDALEGNKSRNNCEFHIIKGFISSKKLDLTNLDDCGGYGSTFIENNNTTIPSFHLDEIHKKNSAIFNVLVADCEGGLEMFFDENPRILDWLRMIIFEADYPDKCNYNKIQDNLTKKGFICVIGGFQNVWKRFRL